MSTKYIASRTIAYALGGNLIIEGNLQFPDPLNPNKLTTKWYPLNGVVPQPANWTSDDQVLEAITAYLNVPAEWAVEPTPAV